VKYSKVNEVSREFLSNNYQHLCNLSALATASLLFISLYFFCGSFVLSQSRLTGGGRKVDRYKILLDRKRFTGDMKNYFPCFSMEKEVLKH
jgi:hypothetical protein